MTQSMYSDRVFLFLQGPHGPFFAQLSGMLQRAGAQTWRVGFNAGDAAFWKDKSHFIAYRDRIEDWPNAFDMLVNDKGVTDIVLYGDTRPIHEAAVAQAQARGLTVHVFEEGYLRPWWVTYEHGGTNGNSPLMSMTVDEMARALDHVQSDTIVPPGHWGDIRHHMLYGALYHWFVMFRNGRFANFTPHRDISVSREFRLHFKRFLRIPLSSLQRVLATSKIRLGGFPYHLALLQLEHDSAFQKHSPFADLTEFLDVVMQSFAKGAPQHHHLVIKAHPLEDGRTPLRQNARALAKKYGLEDRVHFLGGGKLAQLLDDAKSAITVNSTAGQQALWRGIPLKAFGDAVYAKPEFISQQSLTAFFENAHRPNREAYQVYRRFLLQTSQMPGGFYTARGRRQLLRQVVDVMLSAQDPYAVTSSKSAAYQQQLRLVK